MVRYKSIGTINHQTKFGGTKRNIQPKLILLDNSKLDNQTWYLMTRYRTRNLISHRKHNQQRRRISESTRYHPKSPCNLQGWPKRWMQTF